MKIKIVYSDKSTSNEIINELIKIESDVYEPDYCGEYTSIENRFNKMKFVKEKDNIIISVRNTYDGELIIKDGEIQTSKRHEIDEHGIGIKNKLEKF